MSTFAIANSFDPKLHTVTRGVEASRERSEALKLSRSKQHGPGCVCFRSDLAAVACPLQQVGDPRDPSLVSELDGSSVTRR